MSGLAAPVVLDRSSVARRLLATTSGGAQPVALLNRFLRHWLEINRSD
jgi:hypothetical protein